MISFKQFKEPSVVTLIETTITETLTDKQRSLVDDWINKSSNMATKISFHIFDHPNIKKINNDRIEIPKSYQTNQKTIIKTHPLVRSYI